MIQASIYSAGGTLLLLFLAFLWSFQLQHFVQSCMHVLYAEQDEGIEHCNWKQAVSEHKHIRFCMQVSYKSWLVTRAVWDGISTQLLRVALRCRHGSLEGLCDVPNQFCRGLFLERKTLETNLIKSSNPWIKPTICRLYCKHYKLWFEAKQK